MTQQDLRAQLDTLPLDQVVLLLCDEFMKMEFRAETAEQQLAAYLAGNTPQQQIARSGMISLKARMKRHRAIPATDAKGRYFARKQHSAA